MEKTDRIQIPLTNHTHQRHYNRRNLFQDQRSVTLFWKKKEISQDRQLPISPKKKKKKVMDH